MLRVAFLASNNGSSMQAIVRAIESGDLLAEACLIISNRKHSRALEFGEACSIPVALIPTLPDPLEADSKLYDALSEVAAELVVLSGYLRKLGPRMLSGFRGRILNVHPALLPNYGGEGMYGRKVHEAVLAAGERETGASIHLVDEEYDHGQVIAIRRVQVSPYDDVGDVERRVNDAERSLFIETIRRISYGEIRLPI